MAVPKRRTLFIDSADPLEVELALKSGFQGVTTNPSLAAKSLKTDSSRDFMGIYVEHMNKLTGICNQNRLLDESLPSLSVEVISLKKDEIMPPKQEMIEQAMMLRERIPYENLAVKIPVSCKNENYIDIIRELAKRGFKINATCAYSAGQLEMAAMAGARFVSLFYNRLIDDFNGKYASVVPNSQGKGLEQALGELRQLRRFLDDNPGLDSEIILGSIREPYDLTNGFDNGADIITTSYKVVEKLMKHAATDKSVADFDKDLKKLMFLQ